MTEVEEQKQSLNISDNQLHEDELQIVAFKIASEEFGVSIFDVREIIRMEAITPVPNSDSLINGIINLRGKIVVVVDMAKKLGLQLQPETEDRRIVVLENGDSVVGVVVDRVSEVIRLSESVIKEPPKLISEKINTEYIEGVGVLPSRLVILLETNKLLADVGEKTGMLAIMPESSDV